MPNLKNKKVIKDQQGQRKYPGRVTKIQGNTMATTGYGDIPLYVVPNVGNPMVVPADSGNRVFPGASSFIEYPIAKNSGWLEKYQDGGKKLDTSNWKQSSIDSLNLYNQGNEMVKWAKNNPNFTTIEHNKKADELNIKYPVSSMPWNKKNSFIGSTDWVSINSTKSGQWGVPLYDKPVGVQKKKAEPVKKIVKTETVNLTEPVKTQAINIPNPIDENRREVNFGQKYQTFNYPGQHGYSGNDVTSKYFDPTTKNEIDVSKSFDLKGNYNPVYLEQKKYGGLLEKYGDGGLKSVTGPAPKLDAKTIAEGKRIASGYNNANKQNAEISQTRNWSQAEQDHSNMVKARINNPASDVGILAANMASNLTRLRNLTPEEIARVTDNVGETVNLSLGIATDALTNELVGYGATKAIPFVSKSAKSAGKYLTEQTALKNAYKLNPYAFKPNPESYYRMVGKEGIKDATESGIIRANQKIPLADNGEPFGGLTTPEFEDAYFSKSRPFDGREYGKTPWYGKYEGPGMIEVKNKDYFKPLSKHIDYIGLPKSTIKTSDEAIKFYKEHWLQGYKEVPKELPGSSNKINTKKMWRIENPNIKFNPSKVANENAQQEHVGNWFSDDINYVSDYLRKNQKVPGSRLAEVNVPESELSKYHISNYPDMKDVEPRNWLIPDAFNRNYTDLSHLPISGGNLSKIKENQNYIKELVNKKIAEKKYGGWLDTYEDGGEIDPPGGLKNNQWMGANLNKEGYITSETKGGNRISFTSDQKADDFFNKQIDSGKWGFDPKTGGTFLLKKPVKGLSKEDQFIATKEYHDLRAPKGFTNESQKEQIAKLPKFQQDIINAENEKRRKKVVSDSMQEVGKHPLFYAPGIIGAAPFAVAGLSEAGMASAPYIKKALSTQLPGMANVSGATVGNAIGSMFIGHGAAHITPDAIEMYKNPSWSNAGSLLMDVAEISPLIGPTSKVIGKGLNAAGKYLTEETALQNAWKLNSKAFKENPKYYYRGIGKEGLKKAQETNLIGSKNPQVYTSPYFAKQGDFKIAQHFNPDVIVEAKGKSLYDDLTNLNKDDLVFTRSNMGSVPLKHSSLSKVTPGVNLEGNLADIGLEGISLNNPNIRVLKKDWWQRYKPIEFNKNTPSSPNVDFSKYLTQEQAVAARGERLISQKNKPGWNEQLTPELEQRLSTAVERHNPASDLLGESLGVNLPGRTGTEVSKNAISEGILLNEANKARIAAHETGHYYTNSSKEGAEWLSHFDLSKLSGKIRKYFKGNDRFDNYANEIRERAAQLKDYISQKNKIPLNKDFTITETMLDDAIKNYVKDTGLNNSMSEMLGALKNKKGLLKTMNKFALGTVPAVIGAEALQNKQDNSQWLDKYK